MNNLVRQNHVDLEPTRPEYRHDIKAFNQYLNGRPLSESTIGGYFQTMQDRGRSAATIQRHKSSIKAAIRAQAGNGLTIYQLEKFNVFFRNIKTTKRDVSVTGDDYLTAEHLRILVAAAGPKTSLIIRALYSTAARVSELCNIRLDHCTPGPDGVSIRVLGKGNKEGEVFIDVLLFGEIRAAYKGTTYLFEHNGEPLSRHSVYTMIRRAGAKYLPKVTAVDENGKEEMRDRKVHPHTLRHTAATLLLPRLGLPKTSKYLRHSQLETTVKFYLHGKAEKAEVLAAAVLALTAA